ncbi:MAG TPA: V-type ATP synthase subunit D [Gaiellaceae bacterium]|nr:V-type ATP synthase subunit D [Gaiellaceae bacterium]
MALRIPPGRAGRPWLIGHIEIAQRGADVLEQKRQALLREELRLREELAEAERRWVECSGTAAAWLRRAALLGGERPLRLARFYAGGSARVELAWRNSLGVVHPGEPRLELPARLVAGAAGGTAALVPAEEAHRRAVEAAARFAAARTSHDRIASELSRTVRRLRAVERRWLPAQERALAALELRLDEEEREDAARIRWAAGLTAGGGARPPSR